MKTRILITVLISSAVFWGIFISAAIYSHAENKKFFKNKNIELKKDRYSTACVICNLTGAFLMFAVLSALTAVFIENIFLVILLHIPALWLSLHCGHRIFPHINNRIVEIFINPDE